MSKLINSLKKPVTRNLLELECLVLIILFFVFRSSIPILKYPFILLSLLIIIELIVVHPIKIFTSFRLLFKNYWLAILLFFLFIIYFFISTKIYLMVFKGVGNNLILFFIIYIAHIIINNKKQLKTFLELFLKTIIYLAFFTSLYSIINFLGITTLAYTSDEARIDYNFALIPGFLSIISISYLQINNRSKLQNYFYLLLFVLVVISIVLSSSRRGFILLLSISAILIFFKIYIRTAKINGFIKKISDKLNSFLLAFFIGFFFITGTFYIPSNYKNYLLTTIDSRKKELVKQQLTQAYHRYYSIFNSTSYKDLYVKLWSTGFDPKNPDSGWASGVYKKIDSITGINSTIVPHGSIGCKIDYKSMVLHNDSTAFYSTMIFREEIEKNERTKAYIYCYISNDFNGDYVSLSFLGKALKQKTNGYNLQNKGTWQKLELNSIAEDDGFVDLRLLTRVKNIKKLSDIKGYIIFASPFFHTFNSKHIDSEQPNVWGTGIYKTVYPLKGENVNIVPQEAHGYYLDNSSLNLMRNGKLISKSNIWTENIIDRNQIVASIYCFVSPDFNGEEVSFEAKGNVINNKKAYYNLKQKGKWQKLEINPICKNGSASFILSFQTDSLKISGKLVQGHVIFAYPEITIKEKYIFNPKDPRSGWGTGNYKTTYPLAGRNVEIIPKGAIGYTIDNNYIGNYNRKKNSIVGRTEFVNLKVKKGEKYRASVYCYAASNTDIDLIWLVTSGGAVTQKIIKKLSSKKYDLKAKGTWQKLEIFFEIENDGELPIFLTIRKKEAKSFSKLNGPIIFAYPTYELIESENIIKRNKEQKEKKQSSILKKNDINQITTPLKKPLKIKAGFVLLNLSKLISLVQKINDEDPIRNFVAKLVNEDTTYIPYKANLIVDSAGRDLGEDRISRWKFALEIFNKEYNWKKKLIGGGFDFLSWFGYAFNFDKKGTGYPHNPFLHILLYSGVLGLGLYLFFLFKVIKLYINFKKQYWPFFIMFLIIYYFSFFSAGHPFDPPMLGFFILFPFLINLIHKNENNKDSING